MMVKEFKITASGKCPICRAPVTMNIHAMCVIELDDMIRRGEAELINWTDPLPETFQALRKALYVQADRSEVLINSLGDVSDIPRHHGREDETVY